MTISYEELLLQPRDSREVGRAIKREKGKITLLVHPFFCFENKATIPASCEQLRKFIHINAGPFFILQEREYRGSVSVNHLLHGVNTFEKTIVIIKTDKSMPTPAGLQFSTNFLRILKRELPLGATSRQHDPRRKAFVQFLNRLGVKKIDLGGETGECIKQVTTYITQYSDIETKSINSLIWTKA